MTPDPSPRLPQAAPTDSDRTRTSYGPVGGGLGEVTLPDPFGPDGRYRIDRLLGKGGMGAVFLAHDTVLDRPVALKVPYLNGPNADLMRARFLREARSQARLHHSGVCPILDCGDWQGTPYLTMPFIEGEPLSRRTGVPWPVPQAVALVREVAAAMQFAHDRGVVHRDLKPDNLMLAGGTRPLVMDFGLARRLDGDGMTQAGQVMGTLAYMPPEQIRGETESVGPAADQYALGVILYSLLVGRLPFTGQGFALLAVALNDPPPPPRQFRPELDPDLEAILLRALAKDAPARWPNMAAFAEALVPFAQDAPTLPVPMPASLPAPTRTEAPTVRPTLPVGPCLTLRLEGTPFVYRPMPGQDIIRVGRKRREVGMPADEGNDFVLRVAGNDPLSARISRQHFEVRRSGDGWAAVDISKAGTRLNGKPLTKGVPTPLQPGDKLVVADVISLEVLFTQDVTGAIATTAHVPASALTAGQTGQVVAETSVGDLITVE